MNYRDLYGKGIALVAPSKICSDFKRLFLTVRQFM